MRILRIRSGNIIRQTFSSQEIDFIISCTYHFSKDIAQSCLFLAHTVKAKAKLKGAPISADAAHDLASTAVATVEIAAEMDCPGHAPTQPKLFYLQREPSIQTLIALRMDADSPISHQKYTLKLSNSSGIKEKDAIKIDAALKEMKFTGNATVASEAKNEARRFFEYEIDF
jgi:hypothetical protein